MVTAINQAWFKERLQARKISQRKLAALIGIDPASMSYMLKGERKMALDEARKIAEHLMLPVTEVMRKAGIDVTDDITKLPIKGKIDDDNIVTFFPEKTYDYVNAPYDMAKNSFVLQCRSPSSFRDGWLYFISGEIVNPEEVLEKTVYATLSDGRAVLAVLKRGYKPQRYNLWFYMGKDVIENKIITNCQKLQWVMPT